MLTANLDNKLNVSTAEFLRILYGFECFSPWHFILLSTSGFLIGILQNPFKHSPFNKYFWPSNSVAFEMIL